jgi:hypothetical protein
MCRGKYDPPLAALAERAPGPHLGGMNRRDPVDGGARCAA